MTFRYVCVERNTRKEKDASDLQESLEHSTWLQNETSASLFNLYYYSCSTLYDHIVYWALLFGG